MEVWSALRAMWLSIQAWEKMALRVSPFKTQGEKGRSGGRSKHLSDAWGVPHVRQGESPRRKTNSFWRKDGKGGPSSLEAGVRLVGGNQQINLTR